MNSDLLSVSECARRLGITRQRMSKLLDEAGIEKTRKGKDALVPWPEAQRTIQIAAASGKVRAPKTVLEDPLVRQLRDQIAELKMEKEKLIDKVESLIHLESEVKLLKAAKEDLEMKIRKADKSLVSRIGKAINAFKDQG